MDDYPSITDYSEAVQHPRTAFADPVLRHGTVAANALGLPAALGGGFALTYRVAHASKKYAVRCFWKKTENLEERYQKIGETLCRLAGGPFVEFEFQPKGVSVGGRWQGKHFPVVKMRWVEGPTLGMHLETVHDDRQALDRLSDELRQLQAFLERHGIAHGDIQNGNVIVTQQRIVLIDYDGMYVPGMGQRRGSEVGQRHWQHPSRTLADFGPFVDRFSFVMLKVSLAAIAVRGSLFARYNNGENLIFNANDYDDPDNSPLFSELRGIPEVAREVELFAKLCAAPIKDIPDLAAFERMVSSRSLPVAATRQGERLQAARRAAYIAALPVLSATNYVAASSHVGDRVELIGRIVECYCGRDKNSEPFLFINFNPHRKGQTVVKAIIWASGLRTFPNPPDRMWQGTWVSITGMLEPPHQGNSTTAIGITISSPSQLHAINEEEARYRLGENLVPKTESRSEGNRRSPPPPLTGNEDALTKILGMTAPGEAVLRPPAAGPQKSPRVNPASGISQKGVSAYSGKVVDRSLLIASEKAPGRLGLPDEFSRCEVTGRRLLLDELGRSSVSNLLVDRDLLRRSSRSGQFALASELVKCAETGRSVLPSELARCTVTGKMVDASLLFTSELTGRVALHYHFQRCALTQCLVLKDELEKCRLTGKWVIPSELETCAVTGIRALRQRMAFCQPPGAWALPSETGRSDYSGKCVPRALLRKSERLPGRSGLPDEFGHCEVTGRHLLLDELARSAVSNKLVDRSLLYSSVNSGQLALLTELVRCEETGASVLPSEVGQCAVTGKSVDVRLLGTSDLSGRTVLTRLMQRCAITGRLVLPEELEQCGVTGQLVLPAELETCAVTGLRGVRGKMHWSGAARKYFAPPNTLKRELLAAIARGEPYANTYEVIRWAGIEIEEFEDEAMALANRSHASVDTGTLRVPPAGDPALKSLVFRMQGHSWRSATEAARLMDSDPDEARRIILSIASHLENASTLRLRLPLEAARMRRRFLGEKWPENYPAREPDDDHGSLPARLRARLKGKLIEFLSK
jgi:Phosphotransferase enzyme family